MGTLIKMNRQLDDQPGDTRLIWDRDRDNEVRAAREMFNRLRAEGYLAYSVRGEKGEKGEVIREFDPDAEKIIMAPRQQGG